MSLPWFKFTPASWRGDQGLRAVSLAARGLWIECLCIMHEAKPYGHLTLNGTAIEDDTLARMTGVPVAEVQAMMAELRKAGVLSVTSKGVVFSRRMTKDAQKAAEGRRNANKRWGQDTETEQHSDGPNGVASGDPNAKTLRGLELSPKAPQGGRRRRTKGAGHFFEQARELGDGTERSQTSARDDRVDAGRLPLVAIGDR